MIKSSAPHRLSMLVHYIGCFTPFISSESRVIWDLPFSVSVLFNPEHSADWLDAMTRCHDVEVKVNAVSFPAETLGCRHVRHPFVVC